MLADDTVVEEHTPYKPPFSYKTAEFELGGAVDTFVYRGKPSERRNTTFYVDPLGDLYAVWLDMRGYPTPDESIPMGFAGSEGKELEYLHFSCCKITHLCQKAENLGKLIIKYKTDYKYDHGEQNDYKVLDICIAQEFGVTEDGKIAAEELVVFCLKGYCKGTTKDKTDTTLFYDLTGFTVKKSDLSLLYVGSSDTYKGAPCRLRQKNEKFELDTTIFYALTRETVAAYRDLSCPNNIRGFLSFYNRAGSDCDGSQETTRCCYGNFSLYPPNNIISAGFGDIRFGYYYLFPLWVKTSSFWPQCLLSYNGETRWSCDTESISYTETNFSFSVEDFALQEMNVYGKMWDCQTIQHNGKYGALLCIRMSDSECKKLPSKTSWVNPMFSPLASSSSQQFVLVSWQDIDKKTPSIKNPIDCSPYNRLISSINYETKKSFWDCRFVVYQKGGQYYVIYLGSTNYPCISILGVARIHFDDDNHVSLCTKREFTNKHQDSTFPEITKIWNPATFELGDHWLWYVCLTEENNYSKFRYFLIDADELVQYAP